MDYDEKIYYLGPLCPHNHEYKDTGKSLRFIKNKNHYCRTCNIFQRAKFKNDDSNKIKVKCLNCETEFLKTRTGVKNYPRHFCSHRCIALYQHKNGELHAHNRSRLEIHIESYIKKNFPNIEVVYNSKKTLKGLELDIYFPTLKTKEFSGGTAIEINGPIHYLPIFGDEFLKGVQENDTARKLRCDELSIDLIIIDVCKFKHGRDNRKCKKFTRQIGNLIREKINKKDD